MSETIAINSGNRGERLFGREAEPIPFWSVALLAIFVAIWTLYAVVSAAPAAIHNDMAEAYVWGREFQLGYSKHPPFWAWIAGLWFEVFPRDDWAFALLAALNAGLGLYGSWMLIGDFAKGDRRLAATVLLLVTPFYTFLALKYNANSIFLSLWPWTMHFFVRSIDERQLSDAILFGLLMGLASLQIFCADFGGYMLRRGPSPSKMPGVFYLYLTLRIDCCRNLAGCTPCLVASADRYWACGVPQTQNRLWLRDCYPVLRNATRWRDRIPLHHRSTDRPCQAKFSKIMGRGI